MLKYVGLTHCEARGCCKCPTAMVFAGNFRGVRLIHTAENVCRESSPWLIRGDACLHLPEPMIC